VRIAKPDGASAARRRRSASSASARSGDPDRRGVYPGFA